MLLNPRKGQRVRCWYADRSMPLHGRVGVVRVVSRGKPRNHGVIVDGRLYVVPCGNLRSMRWEGG